jgi:hypothetical protein
MLIAVVSIYLLIGFAHTILTYDVYAENRDELGDVIGYLHVITLMIVLWPCFWVFCLFSKDEGGDDV